MSTEQIKEIEANISRAKASLDAATTLLDAGHSDFAASRAYYAAFYASTALLLKKGFKYSSHGQVIGAVHREFVRQGMIPVEMGRSLNWLFELRALGDYGEIRHVTRDEAEEAVNSAEQFVTLLITQIKEESS